MGNFYVNFSIRDAEPRRVAHVLERAGRRAIVTPAQSGYVVVYDEGRIARRRSRSCQSAVYCPATLAARWSRS